MTPPAEPVGQPKVRVVAGSPTVEEVAALVVALVTMTDVSSPAPAPSPRAPSGWLASAAPQVWSAVPGPEAWLASARRR